MFEQLYSVLATATYTNGMSRAKALGLVSNASDQIRSVGGNLATADTGTASTVRSAIGLARATLSAQTGWASNSSQQQALGVAGQLADQLISLGVAP